MSFLESKSHRPNRRPLIVPAVFLIGLVAALPFAQHVPATALQGTNGGWAFSTTGTTQVIDSFTWNMDSRRSTTLASGLTVGIGVTGTGTGIAGTDQALSARGGANGNFVSNGLVAAVGVQLATTDDGCSYGTLCTNRGTYEITFSKPVTDPVVSFSGVGGGGANGNISGSKTVTWTEFTLTTPGVTMTKLSGTNLTVSGARIEPTTKNTTSSCSTTSDANYGATASAMCGSIRMNGTMTSLSFTADLGSVCNATCYAGPSKNEDGWTMVVSVDEDFGLAPASYDTSPTSHVVGALMMGASVVADQTTTLNPTTNVDAVAAGAAITTIDDGTTAFSGTQTFTQGSTFTANVSLAGVSAAATLCGWIDFDANGIFDSPAERACAAPSSGDTTAQLVWNVPATVSSTVKYARLRLSFDSSVSSPVGKVASGEVEDYSFSATVASAGSSNTTVAPTTTSTTVAPATTSTTIASTSTTTPGQSDVSATSSGGPASDATPTTGTNPGPLVWFAIGAIGVGLSLVRRRRQA